MKIAECRKCGQQYFGDSEEEVQRKYEKHICYSQIPDGQFWQKIEAFLAKDSRIGDSAQTITIAKIDSAQTITIAKIVDSVISKYETEINELWARVEK